MNIVRHLVPESTIAERHGLTMVVHERPKPFRESLRIERFYCELPRLA